MTNQKLYKIILQGLFFLALISPLIVDRRLFFPYVTGMSLYFRLIVELLLVLWIIFVLIYPQFRPKINLLLGSVGIYLLAIISATFFSLSPYLSFWGDAERMMGLFGVLHFFTLFLIGASIFRDKKDLRRLIIVFTGVSLAVCLYGILQRLGLTNLNPGASRILSTIGNAGHLAAYLIFGLFFSFYLAFSEVKKNWKLIFIGSGFIHLLAVIMTGTRGAYLGVIIGFLFSVIFIIIFGLKERKSLRKKLLGGLVLLVVIYGILFINQDKNWVNGNLYLNRLTHFSLNDVTFKQRFSSWRAGLKGFKEKPILGYGFENYTVPFNKHFEAEYYNYAPSNTYFDRAHNIVIELLATTGIIGFISYFLIFLSLVYYLIKKYKKENDYIFTAIIGGLIITYLVQNLFIFDLLPAMLGFIILLVIINNSHGDEEIINKAPLRVKDIIIIPLALILLVALFYSYKNYIIAPYKSLKDNVLGQITFPHDQAIGMEHMKNSVDRNTPLDLDNRSSAANIIFNYYRDSGIDVPERKDDIDFAIKLYEDNLKYLPEDAYYNYKIAEILDFRYSIEFNREYIKRASRYINKAISLSPNRIKYYYILAENQIMNGELEGAVETVQYAISLNSQFNESYWELTKVYYVSNRFEEAKESLLKTIDLGWKISEKNMLKFEHLFNVEVSAENRIEFLELVVKNGTTDYLMPSTLANLFFEKGDIEKAIYYAKISAEINPDVREKVNQFIKSISK